MSQKLLLKAAAGTDPGRVHALDQDNAFAAVRAPELGRTRGLFVVADGMGGHQAGEVASRLAVETLEHELGLFLAQSDTEDTHPSLPLAPSGEVTMDQAGMLEKRLRLAIDQANSTISQYAQNNPAEAGNLGTTLTCAFVDGTTAIIANIGDSRTYLHRADTLHQITEDHSYVAHLVREGQIEPEEIYVHPRRNVITRSLGYRPEVEVDTFVAELQAGDRLLLCSDGLWEMVRDDAKLAAYLRESVDPAQTVAQLIEIANQQGGADNIGVVVVHIDAAS